MPHTRDPPILTAPVLALEHRDGQLPEKGASDAIPIVELADILVVIGTSMNVYPAAGLVNYAKRGTPIFVIDPERPSVFIRNVNYIQEKAGKGVEILKEKIKDLI